MIILRQKSRNKDVVRVYHTTRVENLRSIFKQGLSTAYQKDRDFENKSLGLGLTKKPIIYLAKSLDLLPIPPKENKKVVLQIDIPKDKYIEWDKRNEGDPLYTYFIKNINKYKTPANFWAFFMEERCKNDSELRKEYQLALKKYGSIDKIPEFKNVIDNFIALSPEGTLVISENIPPEWICSEVLTERQINNMRLKRKNYSYYESSSSSSYSSDPISGKRLVSVKKVNNNGSKFAIKSVAKDRIARKYDKEN